MFVDLCGADDYFYNMNFLIGMDLKHSPFIQNGKSLFDCQEFKDLLVMIKNKTRNAPNNSNPVNRLLPITEGSYLGVECLIPNMKKFCDVYEKMGETANLVGYPCETGTGHYLMENGMLVVNQNAIRKAGVSELINDLLGLESQKCVGYAISVRTDIPEAQLIYSEHIKNYYWESSVGQGFLLDVEGDVPTYLEEYVKLIKSAQPATFDADDLFTLVMEEANGYFSSGKSVDEVIDIIQSRVQIYLDEEN